MPRLLLVAIAVATLGALPPFLLGAQFVLVGQELALDERDLGVAVGVFFAAAAVASAPAGSLADRLGPRRGMVLAGALAVAAALTMAVLVGSLAGLLVGLALAGVANAALQMTANATLARSIPTGRRGLAFGVKQAAVPVAILLGGLAVPTVGIALGWRWTYGMVAAGAAVVVLLAATRTGTGRAGRSASVGAQAAPRRALLVTAGGTTLANGAANSLGAFLPAWAFSQGMSAGDSGLLLAVGAGACAAGRVLAGLSADRREGGNIPVVAAQLLGGAVGFVLLAQEGLALLVLGALVAFGVGWSWPGLLIFAVVRVGRDRPAVASSAVQAGGFLGGAAGPPLFGWLVVTTSYETGWFAGAVALVVAAALLLYARGMFLRDLAVRPLG
ncbi:MFS transporter [Ornithinicoccus halotolerans]|uniref:MFS transporter n=1 Tax=Ornithinicoccus halotolerans TaxID=1748220 RepID=UPI00129712AC|nr:MFS transporter [Ornithinicoccus halotolerans]